MSGEVRIPDVIRAAVRERERRSSLATRRFLLLMLDKLDQDIDTP